MLFSVFTYFGTAAAVLTYVGSTPAHPVVRDFLQISLTDSIDFIRWKLEIDAGSFKLQCQYGLAQPGTPGFSNEQSVAFDGQLTRSNNFSHLKHNGKKISMVEVNPNVLHFLDHADQMLIGNGGYSYALNSIHPVQMGGFNIRAVGTRVESPLVFEGRTPCQELSALLGLEKSAACNKMKWYFIFYTDSVTGHPSYFLMNGIGHRKETMARGNWQIVTGQNGRIVYQLSSDKWTHALNLLKGDDNILFFIGANEQLLVGNEDFSYTLNRRKEAYPRQ